MQECYFAIDKEESLDIIRSIMRTEPEYDSDDGTNSIKCYKHELAVVELYLEDATDKDDIVKYYDEIISESHKGCDIGYSRSGYIDIYTIDINEDEAIEIYGYLHGTSAECDSSYPTFSYDTHLKTWIIYDDDSWPSAKGIGVNGEVTILDFNDYFISKI